MEEQIEWFLVKVTKNTYAFQSNVGRRERPFKYRKTGWDNLMNLFQEEIISTRNCLYLFYELFQISLPNIPHESDKKKNARAYIEEDEIFFDSVERDMEWLEEMIIIENLPSSPPIFIVSADSNGCGMLFYLEEDPSKESLPIIRHVSFYSKESAYVWLTDNMDLHKLNDEELARIRYQIDESSLCDHPRINMRIITFKDQMKDQLRILKN